MSVERFDIRLGPRSLPQLQLWGVKPGLAYAELGEGPDGELQARFGRVRFATPLANLASWRGDRTRLGGESDERREKTLRDLFGD